ncbi:hypothetical protein [Pedobacter sp. JY14-1]|uniref:hypothetical protein n=1 Tax=Pedobacter sp. JY14-1 TaxID=3034151 RepID=UPI0023E33B8F|nr:hypothetical protein [Pedobacter sp. JY14-1]
MSFSDKKVDKQGKISLFTSLESAIRSEQDNYDPLHFYIALYHIFGFGNKIIHTSGTSYGISGISELLALLSGIPGLYLKGKTVITPSHLEQLEEKILEPAETYEGLFTVLFKALHQQGYELEYNHMPETTWSSDLQRTDQLIDSLKDFLTGDALKDDYIDEYILLKKLDLNGLQDDLRNKMLIRKFAGLAPGILLTTYYKVYHKLPLGFY